MNLVYMVTIVDRDAAGSYLSLFRHKGIALALKTLGTGTAQDEVLKYLGLGETEKTVLFVILHAKRARKILEILSNELYLNRPGTGIAFAIPMRSICGSAMLEQFTWGFRPEEEREMDLEDFKMEQTHELVIAITDRGHIDVIMDAARGAGGSGGTVIHALGTGTQQDGKFFGISIGQEKDLIMMVVRQNVKAPVMKAVMETMNREHPKSKCILFSLPVTGTAGIG